MKTYTLTTRAYGKEPGETIQVDPNDPLVQMNVENGVLVDEKAKDAPAPQMTCPLCRDDLEMKRPPKFATWDELADHYMKDKHPGFAVPAWQPDSEEE